MSVASPSHAAFPGSQAGRHPRLHFRGLLRLHSNYGPLDRSTAQGGLCHRASIHPVTRTNRLPATRSNRQLSGWFLPPLVIRAFWAHCDIVVELFWAFSYLVPIYTGESSVDLVPFMLVSFFSRIVVPRQARIPSPLNSLSVRRHLLVPQPHEMKRGHGIRYISNPFHRLKSNMQPKPRSIDRATYYYL